MTAPAGIRCGRCEEPLDGGRHSFIMSSDGRRGAHWPTCPRPVMSVPISELSDETLRELADKGVMVAPIPAATTVQRALDAQPDMVNHPPHYKAHPSGIECIDITRLCPFGIGNAIKYIWRAWDKGSYRVDLDKARFYLRDTLASGAQWHPPIKARMLLDRAALADTNHVRAVYLRFIEQGNLEAVIDGISIALNDR